MGCISGVLKRYRRGAEYFFTSFFVEKPNGLDFSMRARDGWRAGNNGYSLTPKDLFNELFTHVPPPSTNDCFIDIGCGKGGGLRYAMGYSFGRIAGIEIERPLYDIACNNFKKLQAMNRVELYNEDATTFQKYSEFNYFFLFNPFPTEIYCRVLDEIFGCVTSGKMNHDEAFLLCAGRSEPDYIANSGVFDLAAAYVNEHDEREVKIWKWQRNDG